MPGGLRIRALAAALLAAFVTILMSAVPARADVTVDSAVCIAGATGSFRFVNPALTWPDSTGASWSASLPTACSGASVALVESVGHDQRPQQLAVTATGAGTVSPVRSATWTLRLTTLIGSQKDLASAAVTVTVPGPDGSVTPGQHVQITDNSVAQRRQFLQAVRTPWTVVQVAGGLDLDLSGLEWIPVAAGVQVIGDRSLVPRAPRLFTATFPATLFRIGNDDAGYTSDGVRFSGIRLDGGQGNLSADSDDADATGIRVDSSTSVEIDHDELYGWRGAAVLVHDVQNRISLANAQTVWVHDNDIHHNQHMTGACFGGGHGAGYGVATEYGAYALIERNSFDYNRHAIAGDGRPGSGYLAYRNLILDHGGNNTSCFHTHQIDMHGYGGDCAAYQCGAAGEYMDVEYNAILYTVGTAIHLRGVPSIRMTVANNVFAHSDVWTNSDLTDAALHESWYGLEQWGNTFGLKPLGDRRSCDFDGDGTADSFAATGISWWYQSSALGGRWVFLNQSTTRIANVSVGDVNGDGFCDVTTADGVFPNPGPDWTSTAQAVTGDFNRDGRTDIALTGQRAYTTVPIAAATAGGTGSFTVTGTPSGSFASWAAVPGVQSITGDFDRDGRSDILLLPGPGLPWWYTLPVAFSNGDGSLRVTNTPAGDFAGWAQVPGVRAISGDFNGDGRTDVALLPGPNTSWWYTIPVAFSNGDGTFRITNTPSQDFLGWAQVPGGQVVGGDFNHDGRTDLALLPGPNTPWWYTQPVAFSNGDGTFRITNTPLNDFAGWAQVPGVHVTTGDVNHDGNADLVLLPGPNTPWWYTIPAALSNGDGTFRIVNAPAPDFAGWAQVPGVRVFGGDFNHDGNADLALLPPPGTPWWYTIPVAFSNGDGTFRITNAPSSVFVGWDQIRGVQVVAGDFNGDGRTDLALTGGPGWWTVPVAYSNGDGTFGVTNAAAPDFADAAFRPGHAPVVLTGQPVPFVYGLSQAAATAALNAAGYDATVAYSVDYSCQTQPGWVDDQDSPYGVAAQVRGGPARAVTIYVTALPNLSECNG